MTQTHGTDPLAKTWGLVPRYMRERQAAEARETALAASVVRPAAAPAAELFRAQPVDAVTADLRRRIAIVEPSRRVRLSIAAPSFAGMSLAVAALLSH